MLIHIHDNLLIADLQERFTTCFPFLKIEFYTQPHHYKELTSAAYLIDPNTPIGEIKVGFEQGELEIKSWQKVFEVEKTFKEKFGLNVQLFRNANGQWIQTSETDKYTVQELNETGRKSVPEEQPKIEDPQDEYDAL